MTATAELAFDLSQAVLGLFEGVERRVGDDIMSLQTSVESIVNVLRTELSKRAPEVLVQYELTLPEDHGGDADEVLADIDELADVTIRCPIHLTTGVYEEDETSRWNNFEIVDDGGSTFAPDVYLGDGGDYEGGRIVCDHGHEVSLPEWIDFTQASYL